MRRWGLVAVLIASGLLTGATPPRCAAGPARATASWYGGWFNGRVMANGMVFHELGFSAASRTLPFGTKLRLTNLANGLSDVVVIEDRGPYIAGRDIDVSRGTARRLGFEREGLACLRVEVLRAWPGH